MSRANSNIKSIKPLSVTQPEQAYSQASEAKLPDDVRELLGMLSYRRPAYSSTEDEFLDGYVRPMENWDQVTHYFEDPEGNIFITVGEANNVMITAHSDTVHALPGMQTVLYDPYCDFAYKSDGTPLGADDGAGVWLIREMVKAGVPATYVIFACEEKGGVGSSYAADTHKALMATYDYCVSLDRRGNGDVITHQGFGRCCSNKFAEALADQLNAHGLDYAPCDQGVFTDSANMVEIIAECTNLSIGYGHEHTQNETLDVAHLVKLRDALIKVDWQGLPVVRDPTDIDEDWRYMTMGYSTSTTKYTSSKYDEEPLTVDDILGMSHLQLLSWVESVNPESMAETLYGLCDEVEHLRNLVRSMGLAEEEVRDQPPMATHELDDHDEWGRPGPGFDY